MSEPRPQVHVRSSRDLFEALASPDEGIRLSVLQAIAENREAALAYGPYQGQDLVSRLMAEARKETAPLVRGAFIKVIAGFRSERVLAFLMEELRATRDVDLVLELQPRLAVEPPARVRDFLLSFLDEPTRHPAQALVAARLLSRETSLPAERALRVALLSDEEIAPPTLDEASQDAWIAELNGPLSERARPLAEAQAGGLRRVSGRWSGLADSTRAWLLDWLERSEADVARAAVATLLVHPSSPGVTRALLLCASRVGADLEALPAERAAELLADADAGVRAAAIDAGLGDTSDGLPSWARDGREDERVRTAALRACARLGRAADVVALLSDDSWRIRAAAAQALVGLGDSVVDLVMPIVESGTEAARAAAARVLMALRGEEWLERTLAARMHSITVGGRNG